MHYIKFIATICTQYVTHNPRYELVKRIFTVKLQTISAYPYKPVSRQRSVQKVKSKCLFYRVEIVIPGLPPPGRYALDSID